MAKNYQNIKLPYCKITKDNTLWVFLSCSQDERHIKDIIFGALVLQSLKVQNENILIFTDFNNAEIHFRPLGLEDNLDDPLNLSSKLSKKRNCRYFVLVVTGHGHHQGIHHRKDSFITPDGILKSLRKTEAEAGVVLLGQCFSGIFNFLDVTKNVHMAIIGATNLDFSFSGSIAVDPPAKDTNGNVILNSWEANLFLLQFFKWLAKKIDIDGDGKFSLMDAYKCAGTLASGQIMDFKTIITKEIYPLRKKIDILKDNKDRTPDEDLELDSKEKELVLAIKKRFINQEPWVLHANFIRNVFFDL